MASSPTIVSDGEDIRASSGGVSVNGKPIATGARNSIRFLQQNDLTPNELRGNINLETEEERSVRENKVAIAKILVQHITAEVRRLGELYKGSAGTNSRGVKYKTLEVELGKVNSRLSGASGRGLDVLRKRQQNLIDLIALKKKEIPLFHEEMAKTSSERFLKIFKFVVSKIDKDKVIINDDEILTLTAYYLTQEGGFLCAFPDDFLNANTKSRLGLLTKHFVLDLIEKEDGEKLATARDLETHKNWHEELQKKGLGGITKLMSLIELFKLESAFGKLMKGEDPALRDWLVSLSNKWRGPNSRETSKRASAWFLKYGVEVTKDDGTFDIDKMKSINWMTELDRHGLRKMVELCPHTPNVIEVIKIGALGLGLPNPIGIRKDQLPPWTIRRNGMWSEVEINTERMLIDDVTDSVLMRIKKTKPDLFTQVGNLNPKVIREINDWHDGLFNKVAPDSLHMVGMTVPKVLSRRVPYSFGVGRNQLRSNHFRFDNMWREEEGKKRFIEGIALDVICYGGEEGKTVGKLELDDEDIPCFVLEADEFKNWYEKYIEANYLSFAHYLSNCGLAGGFAYASDGKLHKAAQLLFGIEDFNIDLPKFDPAKKFYFKDLILDLFKRQYDKPLVVRLAPFLKVKHDTASRIVSELKIWQVAYKYAGTKSFTELKREIRKLETHLESINGKNTSPEKKPPERIIKHLSVSLDTHRKALMILSGKKVPSKDFFVSEFSSQVLRPLVFEVTRDLDIKRSSEDPEVLALVAKKLGINDWVIC